MIGFWRLDEGRGDLVRDTSGHGHDGKAEHCVWQETPPALGFDGYQSFVDVPWHEDFYPKEELTLAAWVWPADLAGEGALISMGREHPSSGYHLIHDNGAPRFMLATERRPRVGGNALHRVGSAKPLLRGGVWTHVAATYSVSGNRACLYCDGALVADAPADGKIVYYPVWGMTKMPLSFGDRSHQKGFWSLDGFLRNVRVYNRCLGPEEIKRIFDAERGEVVALTPTPPGKRPAQGLPSSLDVEIVDADSGEPLPAKVFLTAADGRCFWPDQALVYGFTQKRQAFFTGGRFSAPVPAGGIEIRALHGFEYSPVSEKIVIGAGEKKQIRVEMRRLARLREMGWYCGEHHLHPWGHGRQKYDRFFCDPQRAVPTAVLIFKAEGLDYAFMSQLDLSLAYGRRHEEERFLLHASGEDFTGGTGGDMCFIGTKTHPRRKNIFDHIAGFDHAEREGAAALHTHPYAGHVDNPKDLLFARDLPIAVALGKASVWDMFCGGPTERMVADWHRFLNMGFRLGVTGSTDTYLNNPRYVIAPGASRTYVRAQEFSIDAITDAYRKARTFATNGPLLLLEANGKSIGDVLELKGDAPVSVQVSLHAWDVNGLVRVEVIRNGDVVKSFPGEDRNEMQEQFEVAVDDTCWLVARCTGKTGEGIGGTAYTSPIYLQFGARPIRPRQEDIAYFVQWLDDYERVLPAIAQEIGGVGSEDYAPLVALIRQTRDALQSLPEKPRTWLDR